MNIFSGTKNRIAESEWLNAVVGVFDRKSENRLAERGMLSQAFEFKKINKVSGDYLEFGLWRGKTFCYAARMKRRYKQHDLLLWGFDSFQGLPAVDDKTDNIWSEGEFACSEDEFRKILAGRGVPSDAYRLIPGYYKDSLNDNTHRLMVGRKAAIVYIDCDLYDSTRQALEFLQRYLQNGTIICFDDFYNYKSSPFQGEQRALNEFVARNGGLRFLPYMDYAPLGKSFIVRMDEENLESLGRGKMNMNEVAS